MRKTLTGLFALSTTLTAPSAALAHAGDHHGLDAAAAVAHIVSSPFHGAFFLFALLILGWVLAPRIAAVFVRTLRR